MPLIPINYTIRNISRHKTTSALTILGVGLVVFVFVGAQMLSNGLRTTLISTGSDDNVVVIRRSSQTEVQSIISYDQAQLISASPEIVGAREGGPLFTNEIYVLISLANRKDNSMANVVVRGITPKSLELRPKVKIISGRFLAGRGLGDNRRQVRGRPFCWMRPGRKSEVRGEGMDNSWNIRRPGFGI